MEDIETHPSYLKEKIKVFGVRIPIGKNPTILWSLSISALLLFPPVIRGS